MKSVSITIIVFIFAIYFAQIAFALQIISPKEGQIVYQGDRLTVIVKPDAGENWKEVLLTIVPMSYSILKNEYREDIEIPSDTTGNIDFNVLAYDSSGNKVKLTRNLFVKLPLNVVLTRIEVNPSPLFLEKLPLNSLPDDIRVFGTKNLKVMGVYSDGVKRKLVNSASGTTYTSSNDKVVTVEPDGKAVAQGVGKARITVRNGRVSVDVRVIVDPYKE